MIHRRIENLNIEEERAILSPEQLKREYPLSEQHVKTVQQGQQAVKKILDREDDRLMVIVGPCSIHDTIAAEDYANRLGELSKVVSDRLLLVMRVYFEKPRTTVGWQGLVNDPHLDNSFQIEDGLRIARDLLLKITRIGVPVATEALDIVTPPYIQDLVSYTAIGARTVESQSHRKMASGLTSAVGFKNATNGDLKVAINAIRSAMGYHTFISINPDGHAAMIRTRGNRHSHMILRGGEKPNYSQSEVQNCAQQMNSAGVSDNIIIDFSHGNSNKEPLRQIEVCRDVAAQVSQGASSIRGVMIEGNIKEGNQKISDNLSEMEYGVSVTDGCIAWEQTEELIHQLYDANEGRMHSSILSAQ